MLSKSGSSCIEYIFGRFIILVTGDLIYSCTETTSLASSSILRVSVFVIILKNMPKLLSSSFPFSFSFSYPYSIRSPRPLGSEVENMRCLAVTTAAPYGCSQLSFLSVCPKAALLGIPAGYLGELTVVKFFIKSLALPLAVPAPAACGCASLA